DDDVVLASQVDMVHKILRQKVIRCPNAEPAQTKAHVLGEGAGVSHRSQVHTSRGPDHGDALFQVFSADLAPDFDELVREQPEYVAGIVERHAVALRRLLAPQLSRQAQAKLVVPLRSEERRVGKGWR